MNQMIYLYRVIKSEKAAFAQVCALMREFNITSAPNLFSTLRRVEQEDDNFLKVNQ